MLSNAYVRRKIQRKLEAEATAAGRYVDFGIELHVVKQDAAHGSELVRGGPPLTVLRTHKFGGMVDTLPDRPVWCGPSKKPVQWYCSEDTEPILLHGKDLPPRLLAYGSEGVGKTALGAQWIMLRALELLGTDLEIGVTAPTAPRLDHSYQAMVKFWPSRWYRFKAREMLFTLACGVRVRLVSTHQQSEQEGSRVQGYNWARHLGDEMQDQTDADADIEMRGRSAPDGEYRRLCTCTAKDAPAWRTWRDRALSSGMWGMRRLIGTSSPFIFPRVWEERKATLSRREYERRVLAMDVGPERQLYHSWERDKNLGPIPRIGVEDVTSQVLARWQPGATVLLGHDPGRLCHVTEFLKAYRFGREAHHRWVVVDEVVTEGGIVQSHVSQVLRRLQERWDCNQVDRKGQLVEGAVALCFADPYTDAGNDESHPHTSVYVQFRQAQIRILPAAMRSRNTPNGLVSKAAQIPLEARVDMVNRLLCAYDGTRRLFVAKNENGVIAAPQLVAALETQERDPAGRAEAQRKREGDMTHYTAAVGYALWPLEQPRIYPVPGAQVMK